MLSRMPKYFFHLMGDVPAHDLLGHECANDKVAERHGELLARDVGTDKPQMVKDGNYISVAKPRRQRAFQDTAAVAVGLSRRSARLVYVREAD
jgi:hypothetical protein